MWCRIGVDKIAETHYIKYCVSVVWLSNDQTGKCGQHLEGKVHYFSFLFKVKKILKLSPFC